MLFFALLPPPLPPLTAQKMKISKQWKKCPEISSFYKSLPKIITICSTLPEIGHMTHTSSPLTAKKKKKIEKMKKTPGHIIILKLWLNNVHFLRYGAWQTDRWLEKVRLTHLKIGTGNFKTNVADQKTWKKEKEKRDMKYKNLRS